MTTLQLLVVILQIYR